MEAWSRRSPSGGPFVGRRAGRQRPRRRRARGPPSRPDRRAERGRAHGRRGVPRRREADGRRRRRSRASSRASTATGCGNSCSGRRDGCRRRLRAAGSRRSPSPLPRPSSIQVARLAAGFPDDGRPGSRANLSLVRAAVPGRRTSPADGSSTRAAGCSPPRRSCSPRSWSTSIPFDAGLATPRSSSPLICPSFSGSSSRSRTWAARCDRTSGGWTSSASRANGSSTTC